MRHFKIICALFITILGFAQAAYRRERDCHEFYSRPFMCGNGECIDDAWVCDGQEDCDDGRDEDDCHLRVCQDNEFRCSNGQCILKSEECDGFLDCKDFVDEANCMDDSVLPPCMQSKRPGPCRSIYLRYYYNRGSGQCEEFIYGGCEGNDNNFLTMAECEFECLA